MTATLTSRTVRRRGIAFTVLLATSMVLMALSSTPAVQELQRGITFAFSPFQRALDDAAGGVSRVVAALAEIDRLRIDNASLRAENERLRVENARAVAIKRENDLLTGLLQVRAGLDLETVAAVVIARESSEFRRTITIDRGTDDGIVEGAVVIAAGGALAGRVAEAGPNYAKVVLVTDNASTVIGQLVTSAATGEVVGQLGGVLIMGKIDSSERIQLGEEVVTAGIELAGGIRSPYPRGLLIGQVVDVRRDANDVVQTAFLQPAVDLDRLEFVLVITNYEGGLPPPDQQPIDCSEIDGTLPDGEQPCFTPTPAP
jgi:rod shape-determining protein MreC